MSIKVHVLAKELGLSSKELIVKLKSLKIEVKGHMSVLGDKALKTVRAKLKKKSKTKTTESKARAKTKPKAKAKTRPKAKPKAKVEPKPKVVESKPRLEPKPTPEPKPKVKPKIKHEQAKAPVEPTAVTPQPEVVEKQLEKLELKIPITVKELSGRLSVKPSELIKNLMKMKMMATINQLLDEEAVTKILAEFGFILQRLPSLGEELLAAHQQQDQASQLISRGPVVTFMGHVDHGKTSLLDWIRKSRVAARESGGITQHIGAYEVFVKNKKITFLDTPGHEAFTAMRARGAHATDIVVLVVAADDGIMPQTVEAIDHARAAEVPIVVAINKCDLADINIAKVKTQLVQHNLMPEDMGGKTITVGVSAKTGEGVDKLLEMILLESEMLELKANPNREASGVVIEGKLSRGTGSTVTVLVQNGTLNLGDVLICGDYYGRVKSMVNDSRQQVKKAYPADPVEISGLSGVPEAGEAFYVAEDEKKAREFSFRRLEEKRLRGTAKLSHISLEGLYEQIKQGKIKELNIVVKADVQGSLEALIQSMHKLSTEDVTIKVIHSGVGNVNISDVMLAAASNAIIVGFHLSVDSRARDLAEKEKVDVKLYSVIYEVTADIRSALEGLLEPHLNEIILGRAQVRQVFKVSKIGNVAGCIVLSGKMIRNAQCRLIRANEEIINSRISSLRKIKEDVKEVPSGAECGIVVANFKHARAADIIECFKIEKVARRL